MTRPWQTLATVERAEGRLELRRRGEAEVVITIDGRVLMNGAAHRSEAALAELGCRPIAGRPRPRVLIGGLGLGYTLRAALDALPPRAAVVVAEIDPLIVEWCRGPLAELTGRALDDRRVTIEIGDVASAIGRAAGAFDAILLDLYEGPRTPAWGGDDPLYGRAALARVRAALRPGGVFAVWSEEPDAAFETRLRGAGFNCERRRPGRGGPRHTLYLAVVGAVAAVAAGGAEGGVPSVGAAGAVRAAGAGAGVNAAPRRTSRADRDRPARRRPRRAPT